MAPAPTTSTRIIISLVFAVPLSAPGSTLESHLSASCHRLTRTKLSSPDVPEAGRHCWPKPDSIPEGVLDTRGNGRTGGSLIRSETGQKSHPPSCVSGPEPANAAGVGDDVRKWRAWRRGSRILIGWNSITKTVTGPTRRAVRQTHLHRCPYHGNPLPADLSGHGSDKQTRQPQGQCRWPAR